MSKASSLHVQACKERAEAAEARAHAAMATAADLQQHVTWQETRIKDLESQVSTVGGLSSTSTQTNAILNSIH